MRLPLAVCVICFLPPLSGDLNSRVSHIRSKTEPRSTPLHVFDREEYQVTTIAHFFFTGFRLGRVFIVLLLSFRLFEARSPVSGCSKPDLPAVVECAVRARRLACKAAGRIRAKICGGLKYLERDAEIRNCPRQ